MVGQDYKDEQANQQQGDGHRAIAAGGLDGAGTHRLDVDLAQPRVIELDEEEALEPPEVRASVVGRHLLQSAWLAKWVYGRFGSPAVRYLVQSDYARKTALRWYRGEPLSALSQARLAAGLALSAL